MKKQLFTLVILVAMLVCPFMKTHAQNPGLKWALGFSGGGNGDELNFISNVILDSITGDVYVSGTVGGVVDLDPDDNKNFYIGENQKGTQYIAKYRQDGSFVHAITYLLNSKLQIIQDAEGNIYALGGPIFPYDTNPYGTDFDLDPGAGSFIVPNPSTNPGTPFLVKFDKELNFTWAKYWSPTERSVDFGMPNMYLRGGDKNLTLDKDNNILVRGAFYESALDLNPNTGATDTNWVSADGKSASFLVKLDKDGGYLWGKKIEPDGYNSTAGSIKTDGDNNIYSHGLVPDNSGNMEIGYIQKSNTTGDVVWRKTFEADGSIVSYSRSAVNSITISSTGNILALVIAAGYVDLDPGSGVVPINTGNANHWFHFLVNLDNNGNLISYDTIFTALGNTFFRHQLDKEGNIYLLGGFSGTDADFDPGPGTHLLTSFADPSLQDIILWKLNANQEFQWVKRMGGRSIDRAYDVAIDASGNNIFLVGTFAAHESFGQTADFDPDGNGLTLTSIFAGGGFIVNFSCNVYTDDTLAGCNEAFFNGITYTESGTFLSSPYPAANGCDSIVRLIVNIDSLDTEVTLTDSVTLKANLADATYQWINCEDNSVIAGATAQSFVAEKTGKYAVVITASCGTDTSECVDIEIKSGGNSIATIGNPNGIGIYPNPASDMFYINNPTGVAIERIQITNILGQVVCKYQAEGKRTVQQYSLNSLTKGMYMVQVFTANAQKPTLLKLTVK